MKITGINISEKAIQIAVLQQAWSSSVVKTYISEIVPAGETCQYVLSSLSLQLSSSKDIIISIPRRYVFMKIIEMPSLKDIDLKKALGYEVEEHIPYPIQDVVYDFCILRQAEKTRVLLVAVQKAVVESYLEMVKGVSAIDISVSISSLALLSLCLSQEQEKDWMLCYREENCHEIFVVKDGCLSLVQTIHEQEVEKEIIKVIENHLVKKIISSGNVSKQLKTISGVRMEEFVLPDSIKIPSQIKHPSPIPIALALNKLPKARLRINLYPERDLQKKRALNKQLKTTILLLFLMVFCMNLLFLINIRRMENTLQLIRLEINRIQPKVVHLVNNKTSIEHLTKNMEKLKSAILDTPCYLDALNELATIISTETRIEGVNIQGRKCLITGYTPAVTALLTAIEKSGSFEQVELVGGITKEMGMERFEIQMLVGE
ncbi:pilus assembly protein PilM [Candidatus Desantisbacteria bacterium]|nr:pilus assembly protein PilM [Candidatus Desantisbacteria bacterium]